jgi:hypothetical protein
MRLGSDLQRAPKSVSVLWAMGSPELRAKIEAAHDAAVQEAVDYLEENAAITRRGKGGKQREKAFLVVAIFEHSASRALDPALHSHALVTNLALREDGTWGTLPPASSRQHGQSPEYRYQQAAKTLRHLEAGIDIDPLFYVRLERTVRKNGTVRLDGQLYEVPLSLRALKIQLLLDPFRRARIEVWHQNKFMGLAKKAPLHLNSQIGGGCAYDR